MVFVAKTGNRKEKASSWSILVMFALCLNIAPASAVYDPYSYQVTTAVPTPSPTAPPTPYPTPIPFSTISGTVLEDTIGDGVGNAGLSGVTLTLKNKSDGIVIGTVVTDSSGNYSFKNLPPGDYVIVQTNLDGYVDVSDTSGSPTDSTINISVMAGQSAAGNNFVDMRLGSISGQVMEDSNYDGIGDKPLPSVTIRLKLKGKVIATTLTDSTGAYKFQALPNAQYFVIQNNLPGYVDVSDTQGVKKDSRVRVILGVGKDSVGNNFVDALRPTNPPTKYPTAYPTRKPTPAPTAWDWRPTPSPTMWEWRVNPTSLPTSAPTKNPTAIPTLAPTSGPTASPTAKPTPGPTASPTAKPTSGPTASPTAKPTPGPTASPTPGPTASPTAKPTPGPTASPTAKPTPGPTASPTAMPTPGPTASPTAKPTSGPTAIPTATPTSGPTASPTPGPTASPTASPTPGPTARPTSSPTSIPTATPTALPTFSPTTARPTTLMPSERVCVLSTNDVVVALVIDGSESIREADFAKQIVFAVDLVTAIQTKATGSSFSVVLFGDKVATSTPTNQNANATIAVLKSLVHPKGSTFTEGGLRAGQATFLNDSKPKAIILLTDGLPTVFGQSEAETLAKTSAAAQEIKDAGTIIASVGVLASISNSIAKELTENLNTWSSSPRLVFTPPDFIALNGIVDEIIAEIECV